MSADFGPPTYVAADAGLPTDGPAYADPPAGSHRRTWLLAGLASAVAVAVALVLVFTLDGGTDDKTATPRSAVTAYMYAAKAVDKVAAHEVVCDRVWQQVKDDHTSPTDSERIERFTVGDATITGEVAKVPVQVTLHSGQSESGAFIVNRVRGRWLVCNATAN